MQNIESTIANLVKKHKTPIIITTTALLVLLYVIIYYEATRRNITSASNERIAFLQQEIAAGEAQIAYLTQENYDLQVVFCLLYNTEHMLAISRANYTALLNAHAETRLELINATEEERYWRYRYWRNNWIMHDLRMYDMDAPIITSVNADPAIIDMVTRHFNAMYTGNLEEYLATIVGGDTWEYPGISISDDAWGDRDGDWTWTDWLMLTFRRVSEQENYRMSVRVIPGRPSWISHQLSVWVLVQPTPDCEPFLDMYSLHISLADGVWRVHDYH